MNQHLVFDADLIKRYDQSGPRYTSYPTVAQFHDGITEEDYRRWAQHSNEDPIPRGLSLYLHIPFCDTVCFYCACNKVVTKNHDRATPYLDHLYREIAMQSALFDRDRTVEQLHWGGGTPTFLDPDQIRSLMKVIRRHFSLRDDDKGEYSIEIDPRSVDYEKLRTLRMTGFNRVSLGVQDFNPRVQKAVNRIQSEDLTREVTSTARELGFKSINMDLMYGLPYQSVKSFEETLELTIAIGPDRLAIYNYAHLPERFKPQRRISEENLPSADEKLDILQATIETLTNAGYVYIGMDHFARPDDELAIAQREGTLHRNFQGYSTHADCDLVGMGVSSISKVCDNYNQSVRDLEEYYRLIDAGRLPLERGIELEPDDLLRREAITQLMCHFVLDMKALEEKWNFNYKLHFKKELEDLQTMQADGLLNIKNDILTVLPPGRLLVRNICMVFDKYLRDNKTQVRFSKVI
ncbi:MAG: oxygen-independent coproporphyrinogen III oxidase [Gammaproteobacteria bacterium]|nr:oxygen-independent coproporphyrinogen III oxidase [Gammaproteobacteria bacterium]MDH3561087.1 oxygen-independent coproporphyrinogen III oxidase [Gammaproteobacteria bacterium]